MLVLTLFSKRRERSKMSEVHWLQQLNERLEALKLKPVGSSNVPGTIHALWDWCVLFNFQLEFIPWLRRSKVPKTTNKYKPTRVERLKCNTRGVFIDSLYDTDDEHEAMVFQREKDKLLGTCQTQLLNILQSTWTLLCSFTSLADCLHRD